MILPAKRQTRNSFRSINRRTVDALVSVAHDLTAVVFREAVETVGVLTFPEFGAFYNNGGFVLMPFVELLDWRKFSGERPVVGGAGQAAATA